MKTNIRIAILGSGKMAQNFSRVLTHAGYQISEVYSRNSANGVKLSKKVNAHYVGEVGQLSSADFYFLAVVDDAVESISEKINTKKGTLVHFSGNKNLNFSDHRNKGVFWPIFSINDSPKKNWNNIPVVINATSRGITNQLRSFCANIGASPHLLDDNQKKIAHLAAVFANNFTVHMANTSLNLLRESNLDESLVSAILKQTSESMHKSKRIVQTGPAIRGDKRVMKEHLHILESNPNLRNVYRSVSKSITES